MWSGNERRKCMWIRNARRRGMWNRTPKIINIWSRNSIIIFMWSWNERRRDLWSRTLRWRCKWSRNEKQSLIRICTPKWLRILNHSLLHTAFATRIWHAGKLVFKNVSRHLRLLLRIRSVSVQWLTPSKCDSNLPRRGLNLLWVQTFLSLNQRQISITAFSHFDKHANSFLPIPQPDVTSNLSFRSQIRHTSRTKTHVS